MFDEVANFKVGRNHCISCRLIRQEVKGVKVVRFFGSRSLSLLRQHSARILTRSYQAHFHP